MRKFSFIVHCIVTLFFFSCESEKIEPLYEVWFQKAQGLDWFYELNCRYPIDGSDASYRIYRFDSVNEYRTSVVEPMPSYDRFCRKVRKQALLPGSFWATGGRDDMIIWGKILSCEYNDSLVTIINSAHKTKNVFGRIDYQVSLYLQRKLNSTDHFFPTDSLGKEPKHPDDQHSLLYLKRDQINVSTLELLDFVRVRNFVNEIKIYTPDSLKLIIFDDDYQRKLQKDLRSINDKISARSSDHDSIYLIHYDGKDFVDPILHREIPETIKTDKALNDFLKTIMQEDPTIGFIRFAIYL